MTVMGYFSEVFSTLTRFQKEGFLCNTILCASGKELQAHSVLLAAASPIFQSALQDSIPGQHYINLPDLDASVAEIALHFIYTGTLLLPQKYARDDQLAELLETLQDLGLDQGKLCHCEQTFESSASSLTPQNGSRGHEIMLSSAVAQETSGNGVLPMKMEVQKTTDSVIIEEVILDDPRSICAREFCQRIGNSNESLTHNDSNNGRSSHESRNSETSLGHVNNAGSGVTNKTALKAVEFVLFPICFSKPVKQLKVEKHICCSDCRKTFKSQSELDRHFRVHTGEKPLVCTYCNRGFNNESNLKRHLKIHTGNRPHLCDHCGKGFIQKASLVEHLANHVEQKDAKVHKCKFCGAAYKSRSNLRKHLFRFHESDSTSPFKRNAKEGNGSDIALARPFLCDFCGKGLATMGSLKLHKTLNHAEEKPFFCETCGKRFVLENHRDQHLLVHMDERPYTCHQCDKGFCTKGQFDHHMRLHTGEKPYACPTCRKAFTYKDKLTIHMRLHSGEKPYICEICSKGHTQAPHLRAHMLTHTGVKPYRCHLCSKAYRNRTDLKLHCLRVHDVTIPKSMRFSYDKSFPSACTLTIV